MRRVQETTRFQRLSWQSGDNTKKASRVFRENNSNIGFS